MLPNDNGDLAVQLTGFYCARNYPVVAVAGHSRPKHLSHRGDVQPAASHVRGDENVALSRFELSQRPQPLGLTHLPMQANRLEPKVPQQEGHALRNGGDTGGNRRRR